MFYTKYRPQKFSEISQPNEAADALSKQVLSHKTAHAYLFVGPRGTGKTSTARILAKALNCSNLAKNGDPCDECNSCISIKRGSYLDLIEIDAASNRGIDDIRELKNRVKLAPTIGSQKIYIIDEVHMLTNEAFNALLKTLEEPPKNTTFILCTTELHKVPETIKSRCQLFKFKRATIRQLVSKLDAIVKQENISIEKTQLEQIARASLGGFRDAETMLQQISEGDVTIDSLLNISSREKYIEFCETLQKSEVASALKTINKIFDEGIDIYVWVGEFIRHLRDLLLLKSGTDFEVLEIPDDLITLIKAQTQTVEVSWLITTCEIFIDCQSKIKLAFIPQLPVEIAVVKICGYVGNKLTNSSPIKPITPKLPEKSKTLSTTETKTSSNSPEANTETEDPKKDVVFESSPVEILTVDFSSIELKWQEVITKIEQINKSILGLLKVGKPIAVDGNFVILEVGYLFHKERLEAPRNRQIVEEVMFQIYGTDLKVKCVLSEVKPKPLQKQEVGVLTDFNVVVPSKEAVIDMLDGGLPL